MFKRNQNKQSSKESAAALEQEREEQESGSESENDNVSSGQQVQSFSQQLYAEEEKEIRENIELGLNIIRIHKETEALTKEVRKEVVELDKKLYKDVAGLKNPEDLSNALKRMGYSVNHTDLHGNTLIHKAFNEGNKEFIEALLKLEVDTSAVNTAGYTPLHIAAEKGDIEIIKYLLMSKANNFQQLDGNKKVIPNFEFGIDDVELISSLAPIIQEEKDIYRRSNEGNKFYASVIQIFNDLLGNKDNRYSAKKIEDTVNAFVKMGIDINSEFRNGVNTKPLALAVKAGNIALVGALLKVEAEIEEKYEYNKKHEKEIKKLFADCEKRRAIIDNLFDKNGHEKEESKSESKQGKESSLDNLIAIHCKNYLGEDRSKIPQFLTWIINPNLVKHGVSKTGELELTSKEIAKIKEDLTEKLASKVLPKKQIGTQNVFQGNPAQYERELSEILGRPLVIHTGSPQASTSSSSTETPRPSPLRSAANPLRKFFTQNKDSEGRI